MRIAAQYSFNNGLEEINNRFANLLDEIKDAIKNIDSSSAKTKISEEKTKIGKVLYSPIRIKRVIQARIISERLDESES